MNARFDYWDECIAISFEENGITATSEQIKNVAGDVQSAHENYGMAFYSPPAGEHLTQEIAKLERKLKIELEKVQCKRCAGTGLIISHGPYHSSTSSCDKCGGQGRHSP